MKSIKRIAALLLMTALLMTLSACGTKTTAPAENIQSLQSPEAADAETNSGGEKPSPEQNAAKPGEDLSMGMTCYSDAFDFYCDIITEMAYIGGEYINRNNAEIEERDPDNYLNDPQYLDIIYMPFVSVNMALTGSINDSTDQETVREIFEGYGFENVEFTVAAPGEYVITFSDVSETGSVQNHEVRMSYKNGSIRFEARMDGVVHEFAEFVSIGGGYFALQNMTDRALVLYKNGEIVSIYHSTLRYEFDWDENRPTSWSDSYDADADSIFGRSDINRDWVNEKNAQGSIYLLFEFSDRIFVVSGFQKIGYGEEAEFVPMDMITIH